MITKCIIPIAGSGTRLYPMSKILKKSLFPIPYYKNEKLTITPAILIMLEDLFQCNTIEQIYLIVRPKEDNVYLKLFNDYFSSEQVSKIHFIYQLEPNGLGDALLLAKPYIHENERFLFMLGDMLYKSNTNIGCTQQLLDVAEKTNKCYISIRQVPIEEQSYNGMVLGSICNDIMLVDKFIEKPKFGKYEWGTFGNYILDNKAFDYIQNTQINGEIQFYPVLEHYANNGELYGFVVSGRSYDIGNAEKYYKSFTDFIYE